MQSIFTFTYLYNMTEIYLQIESEETLNELLAFLKSKGVENPILFDEEMEDEALGKLMDECDRKKKVSLDKLMSLR